MRFPVCVAGAEATAAGAAPADENEEHDVPSRDASRSPGLRVGDACLHQRGGELFRLRRVQLRTGFVMQPTRPGLGSYRKTAPIPRGRFGNRNLTCLASRHLGSYRIGDMRWRPGFRPACPEQRERSSADAILLDFDLVVAITPWRERKPATLADMSPVFENIDWPKLGAEVAVNLDLRSLGIGPVRGPCCRRKKKAHARFHPQSDPLAVLPLPPQLPGHGAIEIAVPASNREQ